MGFIVVLLLHFGSNHQDPWPSHVGAWLLATGAPLYPPQLVAATGDPDS